MSHRYLKKKYKDINLSCPRAFTEEVITVVILKDVGIVDLLMIPVVVPWVIAQVLRGLCCDPLSSLLLDNLLQI